MHIDCGLLPYMPSLYARMLLVHTHYKSYTYVTGDQPREV